MAKTLLNMMEKMMNPNIIDHYIIDCAIPSIITIALLIPIVRFLTRKCPMGSSGLQLKTDPGPFLRGGQFIILHWQYMLQFRGVA